jgi:amino acid transporter
VYNIVGQIIHLVAALAVAAAAICHAFGLPGVDRALDVLVAVMVVALGYAAIWGVAWLLGVEMETPHTGKSRFFPRLP